MDIQQKRRLIVGGMLVLPVFVLLGLLLPALARPSNCGGNSSAKGVCKRFWFERRVQEEDSDTISSLKSLSAIQRAEALGVTTNHWTRLSRYLVTTNAFAQSDSPKRPVIICTFPCDNVPQPTIWNGHRRNPAHAVAYSDGSVGLLTPKEFQAFNQTGFAYADTLLVEALTEVEADIQR